MGTLNGTILFSGAVILWSSLPAINIFSLAASTPARVREFSHRDIAKILILSCLVLTDIFL